MSIGTWVRSALFVPVLILLPRVASATSFDCSKADTAMEHTVCGNPALSKLDDRLANDMKINAIVYTDVYRGSKNEVMNDLTEAMKGFIATRQACAERIDCLTHAYEDQIALLEFRARPGHDAWSDKLAGQYNASADAHLWLQPRDDDTLRVSLTASAADGRWVCNYVAFGKPDGKLIKAGEFTLTPSEAMIELTPTDPNLRANAQYCGMGGSMLLRYVRQRPPRPVEPAKPAPQARAETRKPR